MSPSSAHTLTAWTCTQMLPQTHRFLKCSEEPQDWGSLFQLTTIFTHYFSKARLKDHFLMQTTTEPATLETGVPPGWAVPLDVWGPIDTTELTRGQVTSWSQQTWHKRRLSAPANTAPLKVLWFMRLSKSPVKSFMKQRSVAVLPFHITWCLGKVWPIKWYLDYMTEQ